ncbi:MAG TPA: hypothetical protein VNN80_09020, partial [Polyangiaceae bacterium]|nr:hypothetical protein [Polyangiaceae bacterium]
MTVSEPFQPQRPRPLRPLAAAGRSRGLANGHGSGTSAPRPPRATGRFGLTVSFPAPTTVRFTSAALFRDSQGDFARLFFARAFRAPGVVQVAIDSAQHTAEVVLDPPLRPGDARLEALARLLSTPPTPAAEPGALAVPDDLARPSETSVRLQSYGARLSTWTVRHEIPGRIRLYNPVLFRRRELCQAIE